MNRIKLNILANFVGQGWSALAQLAFVPLYLKFLGIEAYGLIGFYMMLQGILQILDVGLSMTINRELARYLTQPEKTGEARNLLRTLELGYWSIGIAIGLMIFATAPWIASAWITSRAIPAHDVELTLMMMGLLSALQWPVSFYQGGLMGLQRQVFLSGLKVSMATLSGGGAVLVLWFLAPTITAFYKWQIIVSAIYVALLAVSVWRCMPAHPTVPRVDMCLLHNIWPFAAGMSGITLSAIILTQLDKVILSKMISLEMFSYYTLAGMIGYGVTTVITPVFSAIFPQFSSLVARGEETTLRRLYHQSAQLLAVLLLPIGATIALFSFDIIYLWTGNAPAAQNAAPIASILAIGTVLNGLMNPPYALQLAYGWTSIGLCINTFLIILLVPAIMFAVTHYGAMGAAVVWVALNSIYMLIGIPLTHRRLLKGEMWRWIDEDIVRPLAVTLVVIGAGRYFMVSPMSPWVAFSSLSLLLLGALAVAMFAAPHIRDWLFVQCIGNHRKYD
jgi:O-antigen/teichoic acid export membrane protein